MARFRLIPREERFFTDLAAMADAIAEGAAVFEAILASDPPALQRAGEVQAIEHRCDELTHGIVERLNRTFVTPIDREDILALASGLDDIVDLTEEVADYLGLYKIEAPMEQAQRLAHILMECCRRICEAVPRIRGFKDVSHYTGEIHRLETEGDRVTREAVASLFDTGIDPMVVIRWKDIFERLEEAIDATEHIANVIANIVTKNS